MTIENFVSSDRGSLFFDSINVAYLKCLLNKVLNTYTSQNNPKQRLLGIIYIFDVSAEKNIFVSTPDRRQWKSLLTIDKRGSEIASTSVFDCHLLPVG